MPTPDQPTPPAGFSLAAEQANQPPADVPLLYARPADLSTPADHVDGVATLDDDLVIEDHQDDVPGDL